MLRCSHASIFSHAYMLTCFHTCMVAYFLALMVTCFHTHMFTCLLAQMPTCLYAHMLTCLDDQMFTCQDAYMLTCSHDQMFICSYLLSTAHDPQTNSRVRCMRTFTQAYYIEIVKIYEGQLQLGRLRVSNLFPSFTLTSDLVQQEDLHGVIFGSQTQNQVATLFVSFKEATCTPKFMLASSLNHLQGDYVPCTPPSQE